METDAEQGQSLVEMVIVISAFALLLFATLPMMMDRYAKEMKDVSLTREIRQ
jgi:Tfp pilus assembly protein FimT